METQDSPQDVPDSHIIGANIPFASPAALPTASPVSQLSRDWSLSFPKPEPSVLQPFNNF